MCDAFAHISRPDEHCYNVPCGIAYRNADTRQLPASTCPTAEDGAEALPTDDPCCDGLCVGNTLAEVAFSYVNWCHENRQRHDSSVAQAGLRLSCASTEAFDPVVACIAVLEHVKTSGVQTRLSLPSTRRAPPLQPLHARVHMCAGQFLGSEHGRILLGDCDQAGEAGHRLAPTLRRICEKVSCKISLQQRSTLSSL